MIGLYVTSEVAKDFGKEPRMSSKTPWRKLLENLGNGILYRQLETSNLFRVFSRSV